MATRRRKGVLRHPSMPCGQSLSLTVRAQTPFVLLHSRGLIRNLRAETRSLTLSESCSRRMKGTRGMLSSIRHLFKADPSGCLFATKSIEEVWKGGRSCPIRFGDSGGIAGASGTTSTALRATSQMQSGPCEVACAWRRSQAASRHSHAGSRHGFAGRSCRSSRQRHPRPCAVGPKGIRPSRRRRSLVGRPSSELDAVSGVAPPYSLRRSSTSRWAIRLGTSRPGFGFRPRREGHAGVGLAGV
mmetsp:Transcript_102522/g.328469  ORF Transcript_102522/g.328469 Transcript_102522/m.328469 type:complete len:243 (-) Transcript_102522:776-1504(-)